MWKGKSTISVGPISSPGKNYTLMCKLMGTSGSVSCTVNVYGSNDDACLTSLSTAARQLITSFTLQGTGAGAGAAADSAGQFVAAPWKYVWGDQTAIAGTGASSDLVMGA